MTQVIGGCPQRGDFFMKEFKIRDLRKKDQYKIDDKYLNGYAKLCGAYATCVYNSLSRHAEFNSQECFPSIDLIAKQHNISRPSVIKGIKKLFEYNIITIIKEKNEKGRQKNNVYILLDKSEWKSIRVNEVDTESRVNDISKPSQPQNKSRVNEVDYKDNKVIKDNTYKDNTDIKDYFNKEIQIIDNIHKTLLLEEKEKFLEYWAEKSPNGKKERWQMEKVFDIKRRWKRWIRNVEARMKPKEYKKEIDYSPRSGMAKIGDILNKYKE